MKRWRSIPWLAAVLAVAASSAWAQSGSTDTGSFRMRIGGFIPMGHSEFWDVTKQNFDISMSDFNGAMIGASYVVPLSNHVELGFNIDYYANTVRARDLNFVDQDGFPILHDTTLREIPLTVDFRFLPTGRYGTRGSHGQYKVRKPVPFLGAGIGANFWRYEEVGDFVDASGLVPQIFYGRYEDTGTAFEVHAMGGVDFPVGPKWDLFGEARYAWADATPGGAFTPLQQGKLDLSGWALFFGGAVRF